VGTLALAVCMSILSFGVQCGLARRIARRGGRAAIERAAVPAI
jgi:hypothetical protein